MDDEKIAKIREAVEKVQEGKSLRTIARQYGIPKSTLYDKVKGKAPVEVYGKTELTPAEEEGLSKWIKSMAERGFGRNKETICLQVKKILDGQNRVTRFKNNLPGKDWYYSFIKRHSDLTNRTPMQLSKQRALVAPGMVHAWFQDFKNFMDSEVKDPTIWEDSTRWYNADETGFPLCPKSGKVVCAKGSSNVYQFTTSEKSVITVMACLSAGGDYVPPMIVFSGTRFNYSPLEGFEEAAFGRSLNGWMDSELFYTWLKNVFITHISEKQVTEPVVLFVDGHRTHLSMEASDICVENNIILYCLLENASHLIQPCDLQFFGSLKNSWRRSVSSFQDKNPGEIVTKRTFASVFKGAWTESAKPETATTGFRDAGLFPFDPSKVTDSHKLKPCQLFVNEETPNAPSESQSSESSSFQQPPTTFLPAAPQRMKSSTIDALDLAGSVKCRCPCTCGGCTCPCSCGGARNLPAPSPIISESTPGTASTASASFINIPLPQVAISKKAKPTATKYPKAATGSVFRNMYRENLRKKEEEAKAKEDRKRAREEKKRKLEEDKMRKKKEREDKKRKKTKLQQTMERELEESDGDLDDPRKIDPNACYKCGGKFRPAEAKDWIGCNKCPRWLHRKCVADMDLSGMTEEEVEEFYFECVYC